MPYKGYFLLHYILIYYLEVPFKFQLPFQQVNVIKMNTVQ